MHTQAQNFSGQVEPHHYSVKVTSTGTRNAAKGLLLEGDVAVAAIRRTADGVWVGEWEVVRFYSSAAQIRFDTFCNCLSRAETLQALSGI